MIIKTKPESYCHICGARVIFCKNKSPMCINTWMELGCVREQHNVFGNIYYGVLFYGYTKRRLRKGFITICAAINYSGKVANRFNRKVIE